VSASLTVRDLILHRPLQTATGAIGIRRVFVLSIGDGSGLTGLGEASPLPGFGWESPRDCERTLQSVLPLLSDAFIGGWLERGRTDAPLGAIERLVAESPCTRAAVEGALLDLLAQLNGVPLAELLTKDYTPWVPVNALIDPLGGSAAALEAVAAGFKTVKAKAPADPEAAARLATALRGSLGPDVALRLDPNAAWDADGAVRFAAAAREAGLEYLEQPLPAGDLVGMASVRRRTGLALAADEAIRLPTDVGRVGAAQAADVVVLKPSLLGGWRPTRQAAQLATSCGMGVVLTTAIDSAIGRGHAIHMAAALGLDQRAQGLATGHLLTNDTTSEPLTPSAGDICIHNRPGLGIGSLLPG
jgi:o-succinylbenzoate synthase